MSSLQQHMAVITNLIDQLRELDQLRDRAESAANCPKIAAEIIPQKKRRI
jgi:hypothetical protein